MIKKTLVCSVSVLFLAACNSQDSKYSYPCNAKYSSGKVIEDIKHRQNLEKANVVFNEWYKEPARLPTNCDTIHLYVEADNVPWLSEDTFAVSVGHSFFSDSPNSAIKALYLETKESWPAVGDVATIYLLSRESIDSYKYTPVTSDTSGSQPYEIIRESSITGSGTNGLNIIANVRQDVKDPRKLAKEIKERYITVIKDKELNQFSVELRITSPSCKLCLSKTYSLFFDKRNKNL